jgi:hypothetical protein
MIEENLSRNIVDKLQMKDRIGRITLRVILVLGRWVEKIQLAQDSV